MTLKQTTASPLAWAAMLAAPLFFSTNILFGSSLAAEVNPFILAFTRWFLVAILLTPFVLKEWQTAKAVARLHWRLMLCLGFLGMWVSGAIVYLALHYTTAINSNLIYTASPVLIILIETVFFGRRVVFREISGVLLALIGVVLIVLRGKFAALTTLSLNPGDLLIALAALSWAGYSILYRTPGLKRLSNLSLFGVVAWAGTIALSPAILILALKGDATLPPTDTWARISGLVVLSSLAAFGLFQYGVRAMGASLSGMFMYLMPVYGVAMAILFLGERLQNYHIVGIVMVLAGLVLAAFPASLLKR